jgi:hypothetical protein
MCKASPKLSNKTSQKYKSPEENFTKRKLKRRFMS